MAALGVRTKLRLINRHKGDVTVDRHRFSGAEQPARAFGQDFLLARNQPDFLWPLDRDHPVINLARQQPEREAHHPA
jgi:hypothetical protein